MDRLGINMKSQDPHLKGDKELLMDSQERPLDKLSLVMDNPHGLAPGAVAEGDLVKVSLVTLKGIQESHRDIQDSVMARLDLNMKSRDPQLKGDRELLVDIQETPLDMPSLAMDNPHSKVPAGVAEWDLVTACQ
ncbi:hypothetical protein HPG69_010595 [Diceros bicornis minor]|uniref:Uncharacterized protein n=1 Tax=Diceros bicornis minor TaxID=77932 RepID=A0A7J7EKC7_DICBM|nr:hypothetical protein HPG69_010595 [Diceros bicornis minor]